MSSQTQTPALCWICGNPADSGEHRLKKADLVRAYGRGPYCGADAAVHVRGGVIAPIQGPGAGALKYEPLLCQYCNNTRTQPFDVAYDRLMLWIFENEDAVLRKRFVDFFEVFGVQFEDSARDLYKYYVKSFACRLVEASQSVPVHLVELLPLQYFKTALRISFSVNEDILLLPERSLFIGKGDLIAWRSRSDSTAPLGYTWSEHVSWFTTNFWFDRPVDGNLGSSWTADAQHIYLGSSAPLTPEDRASFIEKISASSADETRIVERDG